MAANLTPLDAESVARFKLIANTIDFSSLSTKGRGFIEEILAKTTLTGLMSNDAAIANGPAIINVMPEVSAEFKRIFEGAFAAARVVPVAGNGATLPSAKTVAIIAAVCGFFIGVAVAVLVVD